jgi:succinate dehydrogenase flavin-adding protein (antitoxin of CptAB toxin-antitoxin module)
MALTQEEIRDYLSKNLFDEIDLENIPEESRYEILNKLADVVYLRFINKLTELLSDEDMDILENLLQREAADEFQQFIEKRVPNYNDILSEIIAEEKKLLIESTKI